VIRVRKELKEILVLKVTQVRKVTLDFKEVRVQQVHKVL
jgi:hypothetical protein